MRRIGFSLAVLAAFFMLTIGAPAQTGTVIQPGQSWNTACNNAAPGEVLGLAAGFHGDQALSCVKSEQVTFRPVEGASVEMGDLDFRWGSGVAVENVAMERWYAYPSARNLLLKDIRAERFYLRCAHDVTVRGGVYSDPQASGVPTISSGGGQTIPSSGFSLCPSDSAPSTNIVLDGVTFERIWRPSGSSEHRECLHVMGVIGLVIRDSIFRECLGNTSALSFNIHFSSRVEGVLVEGNLFELTYGGGTYPQPTGTGPSVNISDRAPGYEITFRANAFRDGNVVVNAGHPVFPGAIRWEQNCGVGSAPAARDWIWEGNVWNDPACSAGDPAPPPPAPPPPPDPPPPAECYDALDNDGDGLIDAADPGCHVEEDPPAPYEPACAPDCDARIAALAAERDALQAEVASQGARLDAWAEFKAANAAWLSVAPQPPE